MILQVIFDDQFGDYVIDQFQDYRDQTRIVLVTSGAMALEYVHKILRNDVILYGSPEYKELIANLKDYKAVIMHGLFSFIQYDIVYHLPEETKLAWVLWGSEIYSRRDTVWSHLAPLTKFLVRVKKCKDTLTGKHGTAIEVPIDILRRVDYMLGSSMELYEEAKAYIGNPKMRHLQYFYFTLEHLIDAGMLDKRVNGHNILLGNSAAPENNHLEIMMRLKYLGIPKDSKLITPLSYCDIWIKNMVSKVGRYLFGNQCYPLLEYMPRSEYNKLVQSCSVFITNHHRPNAFGNTLTALWLGARVYASKYNVQTKFLQRLGLHVNIIETDLTRRNPNKYEPLTDKEREENRAIIRSRYGMNQMEKNIRNIVDTLNA